MKFKLDNGELIFIEVLNLEGDFKIFCNDKDKNEEVLTKEVSVWRSHIKNMNEKQYDTEKLKAEKFKAEKKEIRFRLFKKDGSCYITLDSFPSNSIEISLSNDKINYYE